MKFILNISYWFSLVINFTKNRSMKKILNNEDHEQRSQFFQFSPLFSFIRFTHATFRPILIQSLRVYRYSICVTCIYLYIYIYRFSRNGWKWIWFYPFGEWKGKNLFIRDGNMENTCFIFSTWIRNINGLLLINKRNLSCTVKFISICSGFLIFLREIVLTSLLLCFEINHFWNSYWNLHLKYFFSQNTSFRKESFASTNTPLN